MSDKVTLDIIEAIFSDTRQYKEIMKFAAIDFSKEHVQRIEDFLKEPIKKRVFEDSAKFFEEDINDVIDAFVKMRPGETLTILDKKSLDDLLIMFNKWISLPKINASASSEESIETKIPQLFVHFDLYSEQPIQPLVREMYSSTIELYDSLIPVAEFVCGEHGIPGHSHYQSPALYKIH